MVSKDLVTRKDQLKAKKNLKDKSFTDTEKSDNFVQRIIKSFRRMFKFKNIPE